MKNFSQFLLLVGIVMWGLAFFFGPESDFWRMGRLGVFLLALSVILYLTDYLIPSAKPRRKTRVRSELARKCSVCGKPALSGSTFCSYHAKYGPDSESR